MAAKACFGAARSDDSAETQHHQNLDADPLSRPLTLMTY
jgi:hypothetical protein